MRPSQSRHEPRAAARGSLTLLRLSACSRCRERPRDSPPAVRAGSPCRSWSRCRRCRPRSAPARRRSRRGPARRCRRACSRSRGRACADAVSARWLSAVASDLLDLVVERAGVLVAERRERVLDPLPLLEQRVAELLGVDARHRLSFLPRSSPEAEARRRSISAGPIPVSSTIFSRPPCPETSVRAVRGSASVSARRRRTASLARPRSGASVTRTFQASPCRPDERRPARSRADAQAQASRLRRHALSLRGRFYAAFASGTPYQLRSSVSSVRRRRLPAAPAQPTARARRTRRAPPAAARAAGASPARAARSRPARAAGSRGPRRGPRRGSAPPRGAPGRASGPTPAPRRRASSAGGLSSSR